MAVDLPIPPAGFDDLSDDEQLAYVQSLWDYMVSAQSRVASPDWHRDVVLLRIAEHRANSGGGRPWPEVRAELDAVVTRDR
jgi:hypothetical protein